MINFEVSDLLHNKGRTIRNNDVFPIPLTHYDSVNGVWLILQGVAATSGAAVSVQFAGSVDGVNEWENIGSAVTLVTTFSTEIEIMPATSSTLRPFLRALFTIPATASLTLSNFKRTKRV